jgi:hypothetical protein
MTENKPDATYRLNNDEVIEVRSAETPTTWIVTSKPCKSCRVETDRSSLRLNELCPTCAQKQDAIDLAKAVEALAEGAAVEITDGSTSMFAGLIEGRTIVSFTRAASRNLQDWLDEENSVEIVLDNGVTLRFDGWGYDASGLNITYTPQTTDETT